MLFATTELSAETTFHGNVCSCMQAFLHSDNRYSCGTQMRVPHSISLSEFQYKQEE